jgi:hypothetical protein
MARPRRKRIAVTNHVEEKYSWVQVGSTIICYRHPDGWCKVRHFAEAKRLTPFHDAELAQCTKDINSLLGRVEKNNKDQKRNLSILETPKGLFLAWVEHRSISPYDEKTDIERALGLK